jgi:hypothetical protein
LLQPESVCVTLENPEAARHLGNWAGTPTL